MDLQVKVCESSSSTQEEITIVPDSFRRPRFRAVWRRPMVTDFLDCQINAFRRRSYVSDFPTRKQRMALRRRIRLQQEQVELRPYLNWLSDFSESSPHSHPSLRATEESLPSNHNTMTTIKEETFQPKPPSRNNPIKKPKDIEDKMAALQLVVSRLHKLCLEKPEAVESALSEETIQQFKKISL